jgi:hypothetical protein
MFQLEDSYDTLAGVKSMTLSYEGEEITLPVEAETSIAPAQSVRVYLPTDAFVRLSRAREVYFQAGPAKFRITEDFMVPFRELGKTIPD